MKTKIPSKITLMILLLINQININICITNNTEDQAQNSLSKNSTTDKGKRELTEAEEFDRKNTPGNNWGAEWEFTEKPYFPKEILEKYAEYTILDDLDSSKVCNYEKYVSSLKEDLVKEKIISNFKKGEQVNCVPDSKSLIAILENGWIDLTEYLIKEIYLPQNIDPSIVVIGYINSSQSKLKSLSQVLKDFSQSKKLQVKFTYDNFDEYIKMYIVFPDASYTPESISIFCYKDSFKITSIVKSRNKIFKLNENKKFFDEIIGNCQFTFNSFNNSIEITFDKAKKLKKWEKLFV
jgi:hypothetical protein